jgi:hypothetical protein
MQPSRRPLSEAHESSAKGTAATRGAAPCGGPHLTGQQSWVERRGFEPLTFLQAGEGPRAREIPENLDDPCGDLDRCTIGDDVDGPLHLSSPRLLGDPQRRLRGMILHRRGRSLLGVVGDEHCLRSDAPWSGFHEEWLRSWTGHPGTRRSTAGRRSAGLPSLKSHGERLL